MLHKSQNNKKVAISTCSVGQRRISLRILLWKFMFVTVEIHKNIDFVSYIL